MPSKLSNYNIIIYELKVGDDFYFFPRNKDLELFVAVEIYNNFCKDKFAETWITTCANGIVKRVKLSQPFLLKI